MVERNYMERDHKIIRENATYPATEGNILGNLIYFSFLLSKVEDYNEEFPNIG